MSTTPTLSLKEKRGNRFGNLLNFDKWAKAPISHPALEAFDVWSIRLQDDAVIQKMCKSLALRVPSLWSSDLDYTLTSRKVSGQGWKASSLLKKNTQENPFSPLWNVVSSYSATSVLQSNSIQISIWSQLRHIGAKPTWISPPILLWRYVVGSAFLNWVWETWSSSVPSRGMSSKMMVDLLVCVLTASIYCVLRV